MPSKPMTAQVTPKNDKIEGWVLNIERYTLHDGPGIPDNGLSERLPTALFMV